MNIKKLKLLLSATVCIANMCNVYAISDTNVNTVSVETASQKYFHQNRDGVKLPSTENPSTSNNSSFESSKIDISDDLNKSFYIPPSVDVLGQPIEEPKEHMAQTVQLSNQISNPIWQQIENEEININDDIKVDWRAGHTYRQTVSNIAYLRASLLQKQDK